MLQNIQVILFSIQCAVAAMILIYPQQRMWSLWAYLLAMIMSCWSNPSYLEGANGSSCTLESWLFRSLFLLASIVLGMWFQMLLLIPLWFLPSILLICNCWLRIAALARLGRCRRVISLFTTVYCLVSTLHGAATLSPVMGTPMADSNYIFFLSFQNVAESIQSSFLRYY